MSQSLNFISDRPLPELAALLLKGKLGPVKFTLVREAGNDIDGEWDSGIFSASTLDEESRDSVSSECSVASPASCIWFLCKPSDPGLDKAVAMSVTLMNALEGDLALVHNSGSVIFERAGKKLTLYQNETSARWMPLFMPPYEMKPRFKKE